MATKKRTATSPSNCKTRITRTWWPRGNCCARASSRTSIDLYQWLNDIRNGDQKAYRNVTIQLQNEDHTDVVATWKLLRARIIKNVNGPFNAKGTDVAMEELTLAYERLEME